ncbi:MAG: hypothetical protein COW85_04850 [Ignavibacteria bacterium CG22_combo_CG10-13_8_21_14_all_37_15]|nr:MAG: hypothetical protein COW85_04850 [Ignavibacteria bacterium CG22_combo_CG10-13_8_21_14_all_37_15]
MKKTFIIFIIFIISLDVGLAQQEKDSSNSWLLSSSVYGVVNYNTTKTYALNGITWFINNGLPIKIQEYIVFGLRWQIEIPITKITKKVSGEFFLEKTENLNSVDIYLTVFHKESWVFLGQMKKLEKDSIWHNFTWDLSDDFDSLTGISFSYQHNLTWTSQNQIVLGRQSTVCKSG